VRSCWSRGCRGPVARRCRPALGGHRLVRHRQHADRADRARRGTGHSGSRGVRRRAFIVGRIRRRAARRLAGVDASCASSTRNAKILFLDAPDDVLNSHASRAPPPSPLRGGHPGRIESRRTCAVASIRDGGPGDRHRFDQREPVALAIVETFTEMAGLGSCACRSSPSATPTACRATSISSLTVRFLPNPYWVEELRHSRGSTNQWPTTCSASGGPALPHGTSCRCWTGQIPEFQKEGQVLPLDRDRLHRGRHRSVAIAEELRRRLNIEHAVFHRDIADEGPSRSAGGHGTAASLRALRRSRATSPASSRSPTTGGSTGRLRAMPQRRAVGEPAQMSRRPGDPENPLTTSFEHRFSVGELNGHAVGNLLLVGLIDATGNLEESVRAVAQVMGVTGAIVPASERASCSSPRPKRRHARTRRGHEVLFHSAIRVEPTNAATPIAAGRGD